MKKTGWYRGDQKPVRVGVYERKYRNGFIWYCCWDGRIFHAGFDFPEYARPCGAAPDQQLPWRGVAK